MTLIKKLESHELPYFYNACELEAWINEKEHIECLYKNYNDDFFVAYESEKIVGFVLAIKESESFGTISNLLVLNEFRNLGYGKLLLDFALKHLDGCQIAIDSEKGKEYFYEKAGFSAYFDTSVYVFKSGENNITNSKVTVSPVSKTSLLNYNKKNNSITKPQYNICLFESKNTLYKAVYKNDAINSYAFRLPYKDGYKILISSLDINESVTLFFSLIDGVKKDTNIYMQINDTEQLLLAIAQFLKMQKLSSTTKMYNKILN